MSCYAFVAINNNLKPLRGEGQYIDWVVPVVITSHHIYTLNVIAIVIIVTFSPAICLCPLHFNRHQ